LFFFLAHTDLENVSQLKLPDTSTIHVPDQQIPRIEPEIIERDVRHVARTRRELRCVQSI